MQKIWKGKRALNEDKLLNNQYDVKNEDNLKNDKNEDKLNIDLYL